MSSLTVAAALFAAGAARAEPPARVSSPTRQLDVTAAALVLRPDTMSSGVGAAVGLDARAWRRGGGSLDGFVAARGVIGGVTHGGFALDGAALVGVRLGDRRVGFEAFGGIGGDTIGNEMAGSTFHLELAPLVVGGVAVGVGAPGQRGARIEASWAARMSQEVNVERRVGMVAQVTDRIGLGLTWTHYDAVGAPPDADLVAPFARLRL